MHYSVNLDQTIAHRQCINALSVGKNAMLKKCSSLANYRLEYYFLCRSDNDIASVCVLV